MARLIALTGQIEDDRGTRHRPQRVSVADRVSFRLTGRSFDLVEQEQQADPAQLAVIIGRRALREQLPSRAERIAIWAIVAKGVAIVGAFTVIAADRSESSRPMVALVGFGLLLLAARALDRRRAERDRVTLASLPPVCLSCTFELIGIPACDDGCTVCPECGAAWRLSPPPNREAG